jgi:hypothetical protein
MGKTPVKDNAQVYHAHAHPENMLDFDGTPIGLCVALKMVKDASDNENMDNEVRILKEFAKLEDQHRRHLVKLYHNGQLFGLNAYSMELGQMSLLDYLKNNAEKLPEKQIVEVTKDIALTMLDFHRG